MSNENNRIKCSICGDVFLSRNEFVNHATMEHADDVIDIVGIEAIIDFIGEDEIITAISEE